MGTFAFLILFFTCLNTLTGFGQVLQLLKRKSVEAMNIYFYMSLLILNTSVFMLGVLKTEHSVLFELLGLGSFTQVKHLFIDHILVWNGLLPGVSHLIVVFLLTWYDGKNEKQNFDTGALAAFVLLWFANFVFVKTTHTDFAVTLGYCLYVYFVYKKLQTVKKSQTRGSLHIGQFVSMSASACAWIAYGFLSHRFWFAFWPFACLVLYLPIIYFWWKKPKYKNTF